MTLNPKPKYPEVGPQPKGSISPRRKTRWYTYVALAICAALAYPLYLYNLSNAHQQSALDAMAAGDPSTAINLLEIEQQAHPQRAELNYWLAVAHRRAGHVMVFQDYLKKAMDLAYPEDELKRQHLLMRIQSGIVDPEIEQEAEKLVEGADSYAGSRIDLYIDEFYEARAQGYLANYRLFDAEVTLDHWVQARSNSIPARLMRADIRERELNLQAAEREYREVLKLSPGNLAARLKHGRLLLLNLKVEEAAEEFSVCVQSAPQEVRAQIGLAECEFRSGKGVDAARERLLRVLEQELLSKDRASALFLLGEIARGQKDNQLVVKYLLEAIKLAPTLDPGPYRTLSAAYASLGQREEAAKYLKISQEKVQRSVRLHALHSEIAQSPEDGQLRFEQGNIFLEEGQKDDAALWWTMAVRLNPQLQAAHEALASHYETQANSERAEYHRRMAEQSAEATFNKLWQDLLNSDTKSVRKGLPQLARYPSLRDSVELLTLGINVVEQKDLEASAQGLGRLTNDRKLRMRSLTLLAEALYHMGHIMSAERAYHEVLANNPRNIVAHRGLQMIYFDLGDYDRMEYHALKVASLDPSDYRPHRHMAFMRRQAEEFERAIADYKESLRRSPHQPTREEVILEMADCYVHALKYQEALDLLVDARPSAERSFLKAQCNYSTKKVAEAKKLLDEAITMEPDHTLALLLQSDIALSEDDAPAARVLLERAVKSAPFHNTAHQKFSTVLLRLGEKELARKEADLAKELLDKQIRYSTLNFQATERPQDVVVRRELALLAEQLGRDDEVKRWKRVVDAMTDEPPSKMIGPAVFSPKDGKSAPPIGPQLKPALIGPPPPPPREKALIER